MADNYDPLSSLTITEIISPTETAEREQITARAKPSGVVFSIRVPPILYDPVAVNDLLTAQADLFNRILAHGHVAGLSEIQDIGVSNEIVDHWLITVVSSNGEFSQQLDIPLPYAGEPQLFAQIDAAAANLDAIAGL